VRKKLIKNSQPIGKNFQKTLGGDFFDSHCRVAECANSNTYRQIDRKDPEMNSSKM